MLDIIHEDGDLLVVNKPAGLVCHPTKAGPLSSLVSRARIYLGAEAHLVHRLDRETGGVLALAKSAAASAALRDLWQEGLVTKEYWAIVHGGFPEGERLIDAPLGRDETSPIAIRDCVRADGSPARTRVRLWHRFQNSSGTFSLVRAWLQTGRKHQIRIHLASVGHAIAGDKIYGDKPECYLAFVERRLTAPQKDSLIVPNHALFAARLWFPWNGTEVEHTAPLPAHMRGLCAGERVAWETGGGEC
jgi:23S rRNA pseudouridine1911/1915/1917 synthase